MVQQFDLNLIPVAQVLLREQSVTAAAAKLHLSVSATSRALERCRRAFGDDLLVRAGRRLTITARGAELLETLDGLVQQLDGLGTPEEFDPSLLRRSFTVAANEVIVAALGGHLLQAVRSEAPLMEIRFVLESPSDLDQLRDGHIGLLIGSYSHLPSDVRSLHLADERLVGVARAGPASDPAGPSVEQFAAMTHIVVSRRGIARGPIDDLLETHGHERRVAAVVPSFSAALAMCASAELTTVVPRALAELLAGAFGLVAFEPPVELPAVSVEAVWHARDDRDPAHRWLRQRTAAAARSSPDT